MTIDVPALLDDVDLAEVVSRYVPLRKVGREYVACCPFHDERSPSFTVNPGKGFYHCFGCGAHGDVIGFVMRITGRDFLGACEALGAADTALPPPRIAARAARAPQADRVWVPILPVPDDAPALLDERGKVHLFNPKSGKVWSFAPVRVDRYPDRAGRLLGYVLRNEFEDRETKRRRKITPQVTYCIGPDGETRWCAHNFPRMRPLLGLDALDARPDAPVIVVSGEKCRDAGQTALPMFVVVSWPGGDNGIAHVDWRPLIGRDVILWPDADTSGLRAAVGYQDHAGLWHDGIAQLLFRAGGAQRLRMIDVDGQPEGWDCADALLDDGWTPRQLYAWARARVVDVDVQLDPHARMA